MRDRLSLDDAGLPLTGLLVSAKRLLEDGLSQLLQMTVDKMRAGDITAGRDAAFSQTNAQ
ncbi:MAG: hypothetical protein VXY30_00120 [Cyanobacteriota bacterium]|nr:hypothetical protein [Cyanobacteriota bacterium]